VAVKKYVYAFVYEQPPTMELRCLLVQGQNPFDALTVYRAQNPASELWPSRIVSITREKEVK